MLQQLLSRAATANDRDEESFLLVVKQCPVCQGSGDWYADRGEYKIFRCTNCTLSYTSPVPDVEELEALYRNEWSVPPGQAYRHRRKPTRAWRLGLRAKKLRRLTSGSSLLEIGCGPGDFLRGARMAGFTRIIGVEPGDGEAEYAGKDWRYLWPPWHLNLFNEKSFAALFRKCGLEPVSFRKHIRKTYITAVARLASA